MKTMTGDQNVLTLRPLPSLQIENGQGWFVSGYYEKYSQWDYPPGIENGDMDKPNPSQLARPSTEALTITINRIFPEALPV